MTEVGGSCREIGFLFWSMFGYPLPFFSCTHVFLSQWPTKDRGSKGRQVVGFGVLYCIVC